MTRDSIGAGLPFLTVTEHFRKNKDAPFFFRLDTHLDRAGHHFYADRLAPTVENELRTLRDGTSLVRQDVRRRSWST